jgi:glutamine synthetase
VVRFFCDIKTPDGAIFANDGRVVLKRAVQRATTMSYSCKIGAECEFYLFKSGEDGEPTNATVDRGGYLDIAPLDKGEDIRREICLTLEEMGIKPEASHHEQGPGQHEIDFRFSDALDCADNLQAFKSVVKAIASRNGMFASFMPKPLADLPGNGLHINLSLSQNGKNVFKDVGKDSAHVANHFTAGVMAKIPEISLFLNPLPNSYERLGKFDAPKFVSWSHQNRSQLVRIPAATEEKARMELRSGDPSLNPYLVFALIISAGLDGIEQRMSLPPALDADLSMADSSVTKNLVSLPSGLDDAIALAEKSAFVKNVIGEDLLSKYLELKKIESREFNSAGDKNVFYKEKYFGII